MALSDEQLIPCGGEDSLLSVQLNDIHNYLAETYLKKLTLLRCWSLWSASTVSGLSSGSAGLVASGQIQIRCLTTKWFLKRIADKYLPDNSAQDKRVYSSVSTWVKNSDLIGSFNQQEILRA